MNSKKTIFTLFFTSLFLLTTIATFNYVVDPLCYFHCSQIDTKTQTLNLFYQAAQKLVAHPETQAIVLGSSRGESTPPEWLSSQTGLPTMNLSVGGGEILTRLAFINLALKSGNLRRIYWLADYFEITQEAADSKIKNTPALRELLNNEIGEPALSVALQKFPKLLDHNTFEASLAKIKNPPTFSLDMGSGADIEATHCMSRNFKGDKSRQTFEKDRDILYDSYTRVILKPNQDQTLWTVFKNKMKELDEKGIQVFIVPLPYNKVFLERLKTEHPEIIDRHWAWIQNLKSLETPNIKVAKSFEGIANDTDDEVFWNDGVHFTCRGAVELLTPVIKN